MISNRMVGGVPSLRQLLGSALAISFGAAAQATPCGPGLDATPIVFAANQLADNVVAYNGTTGAVIREFASGDGGLDYANGMAYEEAAGLFVSSVGTNSVIQFDLETGAVVQNYTGGGLNGPDGIVLFNDVVVVTSYGTNSVKGYSRSTGAYTREYVSAGAAGLVGPAGMLRAVDGSILVSSQGTDEVIQFDLSNGLFMSIAASGHGLTAPAGLLLMPSGDLLVASFGSDEILRYNSSGGFVEAFVSSGAGGLDGPRGLAWTPNGNLLVSSRSTDQLLEYDGSDGSFVGVYAASPDVSDPTSLLVVDTCQLDCNADGVLDQWNIDLDTSADLNSNGTLDECEQIFVTSLADPGDPNDGVLTLREAILRANSSIERMILFDPNLSGGVVQLVSNLPPLTAGDTLVSGDTNGDDLPDIAIDGVGIAGGHGLTIQSGGNTIHGLSIGNFPGAGILVTGPAAVQNTISHCSLGSDLAGSNAAPNAGQGILLLGGANNNVVGPGNVISGNGNAGIQFFEAATSFNSVIGNLVGLQRDGLTALGNGTQGVLISDGADSNLLEMNVIAGNLAEQVLIQDAASNVLRGCFIGLDSAGGAAVPGTAGITIRGDAPGNVVGGVSSGEGNVISGNGAQGILISGVGAHGNQILGNFIGLNALGSSAVPNEGVGVLLVNDASDNQVGPGNVVSGNDSEGIALSGASSNVVVGNIAGLDATGSYAIPNRYSGILLQSGATNNVVGGSGGQRNVCSGNSAIGIVVRSVGSDENMIQGNYCGTDLSGTYAVPNSGGGIRIQDALRNTVGQNLVSGNDWDAIMINHADETAVVGNLVGTDAAGTSAIPNRWAGIRVDNSDAVQIGTADPNNANVLAGNGGSGIFLGYQVHGAVIQGNLIGVGTDLSSNLPNFYHGIDIAGGSSSTLVGGRLVGEGNVIWNDTFPAVIVNGEPCSQNTIVGNSMQTINAPIELWQCGNGGYVDMAIDFVAPSGISGTAQASDGATVDVYAGQGGDLVAYLGATTVFDRSFTFSASLPPGEVCVTVTEVDGSTSQVICDSNTEIPVLTPQRGDLIVSDIDGDFLLLVDPNSGDRSVFSSASVGAGLLLNQPAGLAAKFPRRVLVGDPLVGGLYEVGANTGDRLQVAGCVVDGVLQPTGILKRSNLATLVADVDKSALVSVNDESGQATVVSGPGTGTGPSLQAPLFAALLDSDRAAVSTLSSIIEVDLNTGGRSLISGPGRGSGPTLANCTGVLVETEDSLLVLTRGVSPALLRVDYQTGDRTTLLAGLGDPVGLRFGLDRRFVYLVDQAQRAVYQFELDTSQVQILSSNFIGAGPLFQTPVDVLVWPYSAGDTNGDGATDLSDLAAMLAVFGSCAGSKEYVVGVDLDDNGCIGLEDLAILLSTFGEG